jgi:hypothetical protein
VRISARSQHEQGAPKHRAELVVRQRHALARDERQHRAGLAVTPFA